MAFLMSWACRSVCLSPDLVLARSFPSVLTTMAFVHSRRRWFGTCPCRPVPRGLPSSVKQLRTTQPFGLSHSWHTVIRITDEIDTGKFTSEGGERLFCRELFLQEPLQSIQR